MRHHLALRLFVSLFVLFPVLVNGFEVLVQNEKPFYITPTVDSYPLFAGHRNGNGSNVQYQWSQISGPTLSLQGQSSRKLIISKSGGISQGSYTFRVRATQGAQTSTKEIIVISQSGTRVDPKKPSKIIGELRKWQPISIYFDGPQLSENDASTFTDYRLNVLFTEINPNGGQGKRILVPGHFACSFETAHEEDCTSGDQWRVKFSPPSSSTWMYRPFFHTGPYVAAYDNANIPPGTIFLPDTISGHIGSFFIAPLDSNAKGFYKTGRIKQKPGTNYLIGSENFNTNKFWLKFSAGSPETFLAYEGFDNTCKLNEGQNSNGNITSDNRDLHHYDSNSHSHKNLDYQSGHVFWHGDNNNQDSRGLGIIGMLNYLASKKMNGLYFMLMNIDGDGENVWPFSGGCLNGDENSNNPPHYLKYDVSKLEQWGKVFTHADAKGIMLQMFFNETENTNLLSGGHLIPGSGSESFKHQRRIYYREMISRFSHHLGVTWNLGEEYNESLSALGPIFDRVRSLDPYKSHIALHTYPQQYHNPHQGNFDRYYGHLLSEEHFGGPSFQITEAPNSHIKRDAVSNYFFKWWRTSRAYRKNWVSMMDERGPWDLQAQPDINDFYHNDLRRHAIWDSLLARGAGLSWYFGFIFSATDHDIEANNQASREQLFVQSEKAQSFFDQLINNFNVNLMAIEPVATTTYQRGFGPEIPSGVIEPAVGKRVNDIIPLASDSRKVRVMAREGERYLIYVHNMLDGYSPPSGGQPGQGEILTINFPLSDPPGTQYRVYYYEPVNGGAILPTPQAIITTGQDIEIPFVNPASSALYNNDLIYYIERVK